MSDTWCYARNCWGPNLRDLFGNRVLREVTEVKGAFGVGRRPREGQVRARTGSEGTRGAGERGSGGAAPTLRAVRGPGGLAAAGEGAQAGDSSPFLPLAVPTPPARAASGQPWGCSAPALRRGQVETHGGRWRRTEEARPTAQHADEGEQTATQKTPGAFNAEPLEVT